MIDQAGHNLLVVAVDHLFSNLCRLQPDFDFATMTEPVDDEEIVPLSRTISDTVNPYVDGFKRSPAAESPEEEGKEEDEDAGGNAST